MVEVNLWLGLRSYTNGQDTIEVEADTIGDVLQELVRLHPALAPFVEAGVSVSVDGQLIANDLTKPVTQNSKIYLLQQLKGG